MLMQASHGHLALGPPDMQNKLSDELRVVCRYRTGVRYAVLFSSPANHACYFLSITILMVFSCDRDQIVWRVFCSQCLFIQILYKPANHRPTKQQDNKI